jgi:hypothetical protein
MSSRRWLTKLTIPLIIGAALTTGTGIAAATDDNTPEPHNRQRVWGRLDMISMGRNA